MCLEPRVLAAAFGELGELGGDERPSDAPFRGACPDREPQGLLVVRQNSRLPDAAEVPLQVKEFRGEVVWNRTEWRKHPDTGKRVCVERPPSQWIVRAGPRIVDDTTWQAVQRRIKPMPDDQRFKAGGKPRFLLSDLLRCDVCGAHYIMSNARNYTCSSYVNGGAGACSNSVHVRRGHAEDVLLAPIRDELLAPERVERMAVEMEGYYRELLQQRVARAAEAPRELRDLEARISRLRACLERGDPDLAPDELLAAIERAERKRRELLEALPESRVSFKLLAKLPQAAKPYRQRSEKASRGDARAALKARVFLRGLFGGKFGCSRSPTAGYSPAGTFSLQRC